MMKPMAVSRTVVLVAYFIMVVLLVLTTTLTPAIGSLKDILPIIKDVGMVVMAYIAIKGKGSGNDAP